MASKDPIKFRAQSILRNEIARHGFPSAKTLPCSRCGISKKENPEVQMEYHHPDYSKPLEVIALCRKCHGIVHKEENPEFQRNSGHKPGTYSHSDETKQKIAEAKRGKPWSEETRNKMLPIRKNQRKKIQKGI